MGNVGFATAVVTHEHGGKVRAFFAFAHHLLHLGSNFSLDGVGNFLSVD